MILNNLVRSVKKQMKLFGVLYNIYIYIYINVILYSEIRTYVYNYVKDEMINECIIISSGVLNNDKSNRVP